MNLPLWQDSYKVATTGSGGGKASIEQQKIDTENSILTKMSQTLLRIQGQHQKDTAVSRRADAEGQGAAAGIGGGISGGGNDFLSLIDGQRMLLDYHLSFQRSLADNRQKLAELEMLDGDRTGFELAIKERKLV